MSAPGESARPTAGDVMRQPYIETDKGTVWRKRAQADQQREFEEVLLMNFTARIVSQVQEDDGVSPKSAFEILAKLHGRAKTFTIPAASFLAMNWPVEQLGAEAIVFPGQGIRDRGRTAIQLLSGAVPLKRVFVHTGWTELEDGEHVYLHGGGAIGRHGARNDVEVRLCESLAGFRLPAIPSPESLLAAIRAVIRILDVAPRRITVPLVATVFRSVFGRVDFGLNLVGPSGSFKSELAALAQRHFGQTMDSRNLPASWSSTANAIEMISFLAKDAVLVVDDFAPGATDAMRLHRDAERIIRSTGNGSGRQRMNADSTLRETRQARASLLSTGEDVFRGHSVKARTLTLHLEPDDVSVERLTISQRDAAEGLFASALAAFVHRLSARITTVRREMPTRIAELLAKAHRGSAHRRTPSIVANLFFGWENFVQFAHEAGALASSQVEQMLEQGWTVLGEAGSAQALDQADSDPARQFLNLVRIAMGAGLGHVARGDSLGGAPDNPLFWGWRKVDGGGALSPNGARIGWLDTDGLFLDPGTAHLAASQTLAKNSATESLVTAGVLRKRLKQGGLLVATDVARGVLTVRRRFDGVRRDVLHLRPNVLEALSALEEPDQPDQSISGGQVWSGNSPSRSGSGPQQEPTIDQQNALAGSGLTPIGRDGQVSRNRERGPGDSDVDPWSGKAKKPDQHPTNATENPTSETDTGRAAS